MQPKQYRKRPVVVEAMIWEGTPSKEAFADWRDSKDPQPELRFHGGTLIIHTLEGFMEAYPGDYVVCGTKGEFYPVKPDIFAEIYEAVDG